MVECEEKEQKCEMKRTEKIVKRRREKCKEGEDRKAELKVRKKGGKREAQTGRQLTFVFSFFGHS